MNEGLVVTVVVCGSSSNKSEKTHDACRIFYFLCKSLFMNAGLVVTVVVCGSSCNKSGKESDLCFVAENVRCSGFLMTAAVNVHFVHLICPLQAYCCQRLFGVT